MPVTDKTGALGPCFLTACVLQGALYLYHFEHFNLVAFANIIVVLHADTALETITDFANIIFEAT